MNLQEWSFERTDRVLAPDKREFFGCPIGKEIGLQLSVVGRLDQKQPTPILRFFYQEVFDVSRAGSPCKKYRGPQKCASQVWRILLLLLLTTSASTSLEHSSNLGRPLLMTPVVMHFCKEIHREKE